MNVDAFSALLRAIDSEIVMSGDRACDLIFEEEGLCARMKLSADDCEVMTDIFVHDVAPFIGEPRRSLQQAILTLNGTAMPYSDYSVGIDSRNYLVMTGYTQLARATPESFEQTLAFWVNQAQSLRDAVMAIGFEGARLEVASWSN